MFGSFYQHQVAASGGAAAEPPDATLESNILVDVFGTHGLIHLAGATQGSSIPGALALGEAIAISRLEEGLEAVVLLTKSPSHYRAIALVLVGQPRIKLLNSVQPEHYNLRMQVRIPALERPRMQIRSHFVTILPAVRHDWHSDSGTMATLADQSEEKGFQCTRRNAPRPCFIQQL